jgi:hypothetical protein
MKLEKTFVHEMHEKARTYPTTCIEIQCYPKSQLPVGCNQSTCFVPFVIFVD